KWPADRLRLIVVLSLQSGPICRMGSGRKHGSVIRSHPGRKAPLRTPTDAQDDGFPEILIRSPSVIETSPSSVIASTIRRANVWATKHLQKSFGKKLITNRHRFA